MRPAPLSPTAAVTCWEARGLVGGDPKRGRGLATPGRPGRDARRRPETMALRRPSPNDNGRREHYIPLPCLGGLENNP
uniref:Uncharacterized protein n=1 Tax=Sphaerodactylus townsendi TaxID=933632 RepID=A0ACB8F892_9SAUR